VNVFISIARPLSAPGVAISTDFGFNTPGTDNTVKSDSVCYFEHRLFRLCAAIAR